MEMPENQNPPVGLVEHRPSVPPPLTPSFGFCRSGWGLKSGPLLAGFQMMPKMLVQGHTLGTTAPAAAPEYQLLDAASWSQPEHQRRRWVLPSKPEGRRQAPSSTELLAPGFSLPNRLSRALSLFSLFRVLVGGRRLEAGGHHVGLFLSWDFLSSK